jgi:hypothetical protein
MIKIAHEDRFSEMEMFGFFNVELLPGGERKDGSRQSDIDAPYAFNDVLVPMWKETKRKLTRGEAAACQDEDNIKPGISQHKPGSQRVADLAKFYAENADEEKSAFFV